MFELTLSLFIQRYAKYDNFTPSPRFSLHLAAANTLMSSSSSSLMMMSGVAGLSGGSTWTIMSQSLTGQGLGGWRSIETSAETSSRWPLVPWVKVSIMYLFKSYSSQLSWLRASWNSGVVWMDTIKSNAKSWKSAAILSCSSYFISHSPLLIASCLASSRADMTPKWQEKALLLGEAIERVTRTSFKASWGSKLHAVNCHWPLARLSIWSHMQARHSDGLSSSMGFTTWVKPWMIQLLGVLMNRPLNVGLSGLSSFKAWA